MAKRDFAALLQFNRFELCLLSPDCAPELDVMSIGMRWILPNSCRIHKLGLDAHASSFLALLPSVQKVLDLYS